MFAGTCATDVAGVTDGQRLLFLEMLQVPVTAVSADAPLSIT
jgi:hypothetical protein